MFSIEVYVNSKFDYSTLEGFSKIYKNARKSGSSFSKGEETKVASKVTGKANSLIK